VRNEDGFTAMELLIVMALMAVIGAVAVSGMVQGIRTTDHGQDRVEALAQTQTGIERLSRELRAADPLAVAEADRVELAIRRDDRLYYYLYRLEPNGDLWDLTEERWQFDDGFDEDGFVPTLAGADAVTDRVLVPQLVSNDVFTFPVVGNDDSQADIRLERLVQPGRTPVVVETTVRMRNSMAGSQA
jgi:prepilin-type N-terminal cleavage/methylation domain-containing protein